MTWWYETTEEEKMEFDKSRCYSALNADELRAGDKVIVAYNLYGIKEQVKMFTESAIDVIEVIQDEDYFNRFKVKHGESYPLAYLVERKENCTNCEGCVACIKPDKTFRCEDYSPKTEQKAEKHTNYNYYDEAKKAYACPEKHYRPFKDTDELIKVWFEKDKRGITNDALEMPLIWVRFKGEAPNDVCLINGYNGDEPILIADVWMSLETLFYHWEFLDGTPCGVEE